ncbi:MAG: class I SAM-dependent methyltransferase [Nitrospirae bacterium]|nr:class I SAM-dependent methyltransferase [Nitrospirota bacterium]
MITILKHNEATVTVEELPSGKNRIIIEPLNQNSFIRCKTWETVYPLNLIEKILTIKGPNWLCDEIMRDESPDYVQDSLKYNLLGHVSGISFSNKKILDFGCGSGSSTMILGRMFPHTEIVGIELDDNLLSVARQRSTYYGFDNRIKLLKSPDADNLPKDLGKFDYVVLHAVFEHFLPGERKMLLPKIWNLLYPEGVLFIEETPYRYFPIELHTTRLPIINYLPNKIAFYFAKKFSKSNIANDSWNSLLRKGIRGGSVREILGILNKCKEKPFLLKPSLLGATDRIDLWYMRSRKSSFIKKMYFLLTKLLKMTTGFIFLPDLSLAIKKLPEKTAMRSSEI